MKRKAEDVQRQNKRFKKQPRLKNIYAVHMEFARLLEGDLPEEVFTESAYSRHARDTAEELYRDDHEVQDQEEHNSLFESLKDANAFSKKWFEKVAKMHEIDQMIEEDYHAGDEEEVEEGDVGMENCWQAGPEGCDKWHFERDTGGGTVDDPQVYITLDVWVKKRSLVPAHTD